MSRRQSQDARQALASQLRIVSRIALLVMIPLVTFFTTQGSYNFQRRTFNGGCCTHFFAAQADAMVHGRLDVEPEEIQSECFIRDGLCYGYFGITPSVLRAPLYAKGRWFRSGMTSLYLGVALLLAYWAALQLLLRSLREFADPAESRARLLAYAIAGAVALGPGGTLLLMSRSSVYEEAASWGVAFVLLALNQVWAWHRTGRLRALIVAVVFAVAGANARPTAAIACGVLGLVVAALCWFRPAPRRAHLYVAALCLSLLPALSAGGVYWLKLRQVMPDLRLNQQIPEMPWWRDILQANGDRTGGLMFLPTELVAYLRPDAVIMTAEWPYFDFRFTKKSMFWIPPLPRGGAYVEPFTSVTTTMPLPWLLNSLVAIWLGIAGWRLAARGQPVLPVVPPLTTEQWVLATGSLLTAAAMPLLVVTTVGITNRYLCDFFAISVVGVALGHRPLLSLLGRRPVLSATMRWVVPALLVWSVVVTLALTCQLVFVEK